LDATYPSKDSPAYDHPLPLPAGFVYVKARYFRDGIIATPVAAATFLERHPVDITSTMFNDWNTRQSCFFTPAWGCGPDDSVTVNFLESHPAINWISVQSGDPHTPGAELKHAVLEVSTDGKDFTQAASFGPAGDAQADLKGQKLVAFRIRLTATQTPRPVIASVEIK
jgi:hypothetical protein